MDKSTKAFILTIAVYIAVYITISTIDFIFTTFIY